MIYNVAQLMKSAPGTTLDVELDSDDQLDFSDVEGDEAAPAGPITGHVRLHRTNQGIFADGIVSVPMRLQCARCLKDFTTTLTFSVREEFFPTIDVVTGAPVFPLHSEEAFPIDRRHQLDLRDAIRQNLTLALPIRALCREECAGLCPQCGHDLNDGPCGCVVEQVDERFSALRGLLDDADESEQVG